MIKIAIANQKGGVGKTITAVSLASRAAMSGFSTLLIDLDAQGNVADSLDLPADPRLYNWLGRGMFQPTVHRCGLHVITGDKSTAMLKRDLSSRGFAEYAIDEAMTPITGYDLCIMDCAPSYDILHTAALIAADYLIIPVKLDQFAVKGCLDTLNTVTGLNKRVGHCKLLGVLPTFYDKQTRETQTQFEALAASPIASVIMVPVPVDARIRAANRAGQTIWVYKPEPRCLTAYEQAYTTMIKGVQP